MLLFFRLCFLLLASQSLVHAQKQPNIVVIVADDMGWADVGYHGSEIRTPNIDRLCKAGVELDQHYVAPMCTPTRVSFLTGRYWSRFGNNSPNNNRVLPWDTVTLAKLLKDHGYRTGMSGKWHLGSLPQWGGKKFGFEHTYGSLAGGVNPYNHLYKYDPYKETWHRNDVRVKEEGHATDLFTREAIRFIQDKKEDKFFLYLPYTAVHTPFDEPQEWLDRVSHLDKDRQQYAACAEHFDHCIGQIVDTLEKEALLDNTIILFFSDNGGTKGDDSDKYPGSTVNSKIKGLNTPLKGWKTNLYEGGVRVPAFIYWKGQLTPHKNTSIVHAMDWMPTFAKLLDLQPSKDLKWDGHDIWPLLKGQQQNHNRSLYWLGVAKKSSAYRENDWKLVWHHKNDHKELYNIAKDPNEANNLVKDYPERVLSMTQLIQKEAAKDDDALPNRDLD